MTAAHPSLAFAPVDRAPAVARWPWVTSALIFVAFFLGVHDLHASQHWFRTEKGQLSNMAAEESSGRAARQAGFLLLGAVGVALLIRRGPTDPAVLGSAGGSVLFPLVMLLIWTFASVVWSGDPAITLKRQVVLLCMLLAVAGFIKQYSLTRLIEMSVVQALSVILIGIVVEIVVHPVLPITNGEYRFAGTLHPNHMGINSSILLMGSLMLARQRRNPKFFILTVVALIALFMTKSRTALSSAIVGCTVFALLAYPARRWLAMGVAVLVAGAVTAVIVATDLFSSLGQTVLMNRGNSDPTTLTGRTMIWSFAFDRVRNDWGRIFTGFGYGGFWTPDEALALSRRANFALSEGHNAYLDVLLQLGVPGLGLYLCCVLGALCVWIAIARRTKLPQAALAAGLICFALNHHVAESSLTAPSFPTLIFWCVVASAVFTTRRRERTT